MRSSQGEKILAAVVTTIVVGAVITAIVLNPPAVQRQRKMDSRRVEDLMTIQRVVTEYWSRHRSLPPDLDTLGREPGLRIPANDPETGAAYLYETTGPRSYRLCAEFARSTSEQPTPPIYRENWAHGAGRHCFELKIPSYVDDGNPGR